MKKNNTRGRRVWPWKALIGGVCVASALVTIMRGRGGWSVSAIVRCCSSTSWQTSWWTLL